MTPPRSRLAGITAALIALTAGSASAQPPARTFDQLSVLAVPGETLEITSVTGDHLRGSLAELSPTSLTVVAGGRNHQFQMNDVAAITARRPDALDNGARWGFLVGAGLGVLGALATTNEFNSHGSQVGFGVLIGVIYGGLGAGVGVAIDAMVKSQQTIFSNRGSRRITLAPTVSSHTRTLALSWRF